MSSPPAPPTPRWSAWRSVLALGLVSLGADMAYEGMRAVAGPYLGSLGASAVTVGLVTGAGEATALVLRLLTGTAVDRSGRYWSWTIAGYALTAVCVPLLALAPFLGAAGLAVAVVLILGERTGKAVRSPAKSAILAGIAADVGRGRGFGVHKAIDQVGAFAGPLTVAGVAGLAGGLVWPGLAVLALPAGASMLLLLRLRQRAHLPGEGSRGSPSGSHLDRREPPSGSHLDRREPPDAGQIGLPGVFWMFAAACGAATAGLMTFGVFSFVAVDRGLLTTAQVALVYAAAMALEALAALATGAAYDRRGGAVLYVLPVAVAPVPWLVFQPDLGAVAAGIALWALATGVQDSTVKALVADLVPRTALGRAYGVFAAVQGGAALAGAGLAGAVYADHLAVMAAGFVILQAAALTALVPGVRAVRRAGRTTGAFRS